MLDVGLHRSPAFAGVLTPVQGLGSVASGLAAGALLRRTSERVFSATGPALFAVGVLARATPWLPVVLGGSPSPCSLARERSPASTTGCRSLSPAGSAWLWPPHWLPAVGTP